MKSIEEIARVAHEANRVVCELNGEVASPAWSQAPFWQKKSAILGVQAIIEDPSLTPEQIHERWRREKTRAGWGYGPAKDEKAKTHPCMLDYADLPASQRIKDYVFIAVVRSQLSEEYDD